MGLGGISIWQLLIVLGIVVVIFGTGKLRTIGGDLGGAIKSFRKAMTDGASDADSDASSKDDEPAPKLEADPPEGDQASSVRTGEVEEKRTASGEGSR